MNDWRGMQADTAAWQKTSIFARNDTGLFFEMGYVG
jgi:hypothetical protein